MGRSALGMIFMLFLLDFCKFVLGMILIGMILMLLLLAFFGYH